MANAKTYNDLNQATEVNDTDKLALAQSGKQELVTATVGQVAQKVANIVSTDQVTEIVTDLGMGKQVLAQKLNDKGLDVTAADTLTTMANKVDTLDVVGAKEYVLSNFISIESGSYGVGSYGMRIPLTKYFICFTSTSAPYTIGLYGPNADETAMELKSSLALTDMTSFANPSNLYWTFCSNPKYVLFSNNKQQFMLEISDAAGLSLKWTHTISTSNAEVPMLISRDGNNYVTYYSGSLYVRNNEGAVIKNNSFNPGYGATSLEFYMNEDNASFFGTHSGPTAQTFTGTVDWTTGSMSLSAFGNGSSLFLTDYSVNCTDIKNKKIIKVGAYKSGSVAAKYFYAYDAITGELECSVPLYFRRVGSVGYASSYPTDYMCGCIEYDADNNPLIYTDAGCFKYDILNKSVSILYGGGVYKQRLVLSLEVYRSSNNYVNKNGYRSGFFLNNKILFLSAATESRMFKSITQPNSSYGTPVYHNKQVCTGLIYKRNAQEALFELPLWSDADYEAGAYDVDNTTAKVEI